MSSWLDRFRAGHSDSFPQSAPQSPTTPRIQKRFSDKPTKRDPNAPLRRYQLHQKCLYERLLPGNAFISAHVNRLQHGYYDSKALHEPPQNGVYFVSVHFVFHPHDHRNHRFKSAKIFVSVHDGTNTPGDARNGWNRGKPSLSNPRILKHAPELLYGAVSPENLQWNFSLSSSLGVSQAPVSATVNPSGGVKSSYKIYDMMTMQGSIRSVVSPLGPQYDVEDAMAVWTLEENLLQKSGLPREFDFVLLVEKPDDVDKVFLAVDVDAKVESWFGEYPSWYNNLSKYQPSQDYEIDFDTDIGQKFYPLDPKRGFNFADLPHALEEYVMMPGTVYPTNDTSNQKQSDDPNTWQQKDKDFIDVPKSVVSADPLRRASMRASPNPQQPSTPPRIQKSSDQSYASHRHSWIPETVNVRVMLEHASPTSSSSRRYSGSPINGEPYRQRSLRRTRSRTGLKEYGAQQALQEMARENLNGDTRR
ncbi:hypothetical protein EJ04DRAFT_130080 [Polyplosphaeria fusca]|uniref:Uncharacterized protein n=1 Tax=Polyplosphaeria fusca TaxID=682080 RepID=A0A9P4V699_9PLEO|nr:hypothetical protein EJ04DRAFT_130080 [Polyplosphaeria fusca]